MKLPIHSIITCTMETWWHKTLLVNISPSKKHNGEHTLCWNKPMSRNIPTLDRYVNLLSLRSDSWHVLSFWILGVGVAMGTPHGKVWFFNFLYTYTYDCKLASLPVTLESWFHSIYTVYTYIYIICIYIYKYMDCLSFITYISGFLISWLHIILSYIYMYIYIYLYCIYIYIYY